MIWRHDCKRGSVWNGWQMSLVCHKYITTPLLNTSLVTNEYEIVSKNPRKIMWKFYLWIMYEVFPCKIGHIIARCAWNVGCDKVSCDIATIMSGFWSYSVNMGTSFFASKSHTFSVTTFFVIWGLSFYQSFKKWNLVLRSCLVFRKSGRDR